MIPTITCELTFYWDPGWSSHNQRHVPVFFARSKSLVSTWHLLVLTIAFIREYKFKVTGLHSIKPGYDEVKRDNRSYLEGYEQPDSTTDLERDKAMQVQRGNDRFVASL